MRFQVQIALLTLLSAIIASAQDNSDDRRLRPRITLFQNVRVFDGTGSELTTPVHVLVRGNKIEKISKTPLSLDRRSDTVLIDGGGRTLMPGLIDAHAHLTFNTLPMAMMATADPGYLQIRQAINAKEMLMSGFTSVRDVSGPVYGMKRAIDEGLIPGPRIWPSGPMISQTSGHSDFRTFGELPAVANPGVNPSVRHGYNSVADGQAAVLVAVREQLMRGASQIKLAIGGASAQIMIRLMSPNIRGLKLRPQSRQPMAGAPMSPCMVTRQRRSDWL